ncbi:type VI secretion system baseplate subunit TssG [Chitinispirillales bacterium ANBcel5]|uniref:type VI secretion system baseplate subunit TssG n=1 Tax=Cellulosispirillum alkaliphilum TaxID=3039283 RepID=UPI002A583733|nr:type VI secretion system baseplate subunit TssG [Chitinispirillales bacterium ANBcel5]
MSALIEKLQNRSPDFDFYQAVALLEEYFDTINTSGEKADIRCALKFSANSSIAFPHCDIASIKVDKSTGVEFFLSFMGLLGISSPLPHYFTEHGAKFSEESDALTDFLNIFDHRMYTLFYRASKKYRTVPTCTRNDQHQLINRIASLAGLNLSGNDAPDGEMLAYSGVFAGACRNADSMADIISGCLGGVEVSVEQWVPRWAVVGFAGNLGSDLILGKELMIGERIFDRSGKFRIIINIKNDKDFETYFSGSEKINKVEQIVKLFSPEPMEYDIEVRFTAEELIPVVLGFNESMLGINASCANSSQTAGAYSVVLPGKF